MLPPTLCASAAGQARGTGASKMASQPMREKSMNETEWVDWTARSSGELENALAAVSPDGIDRLARVIRARRTHMESGI